MKRVASFLLALEDVDEKRGDANGGNRRRHRYQQRSPGTLSWNLCYIWLLDVADFVVAFRARQATRGVDHVNRIDDRRNFRVALAAGHLGHARVARRDANWIWEAPRPETERVHNTVLLVGHALAAQHWGSATVIADRHSAVTRACPRVVMGAHDVTVRTRLRIVGDVGIAACIHE